jgi:hypothetical protein
MDKIEQAAVLECLREVRDRIGFNTAKVLARRLCDETKGVSEKIVLDCINGRQVQKEARLEIALAALSILAENYDKVMHFYEARNSSTKSYLFSIFNRFSNICPPIEELLSPEEVRSSSDTYLNSISEKWQTSIRKGNGILQTGIYQLYRRYKPTIEANPKAGYDWSKPRNQAVICELIYVDSNAMECVFVTSERNIYFGSMYINHEDVLFSLLQRKTRNNGVNHRFISLKMEGKRLPMYSGLCIKVGDTTRRPIAAECLYVRVPPAGHTELHAAFRQIRQNGWRGDFVPPVEETSEIAKYLTDTPPYGPYDPGNPDWERVKFVRDFPKIEDILTHDPRLFREPLRTIRGETIIEVANLTLLPVFRQDSQQSLALRSGAELRI